MSTTLTNGAAYVDDSSRDRKYKKCISNGCK